MSATSSCASRQTTAFMAGGRSAARAHWPNSNGFLFRIRTDATVTYGGVSYKWIMSSVTPPSAKATGLSAAGAAGAAA